jgi:exonuclease SbcD
VAGAPPHRPRLRVLHTSDVHLGAYDSSTIEQRRHLEDGFRRVIDVGIAEQVDLMLIAGDFFDNARVRPETLEFAAEQIARLDRPVVIGPGNHDHVGPGSVYDRYDFASAAPYLRLIRDPAGETVALRDLDVEVWGKAHTEQLPDFQPFDRVPPRGEAPWQLAIGHGHYLHPRALLHHSFHIREEHLAASGRDYVALGHWEQMARVAAGGSTVAAYSGAPEGLSGTNGGRVLIVDLFEDGSVRLTGAALGEAPALAHDEIPHLPGL